MSNLGSLINSWDFQSEDFSLNFEFSKSANYNEEKFLTLLKEITELENISIQDIQNNKIQISANVNLDINSRCPDKNIFSALLSKTFDVKIKEYPKYDKKPTHKEISYNFKTIRYPIYTDDETILKDFIKTFFPESEELKFIPFFKRHVEVYLISILIEHDLISSN